MLGEREKSSLKKTLGKNAQAARLRQALTQEDVAERLDMATEVYGRIERGRAFPSIPTFWRLCHVLQESADRMLGLPTGTLPPGPWQVAEPPPPYQDQPPELRRLIRTLRGFEPDEWRALNKFLVMLQKQAR
ncbi:helix-turn-helix transcriptional regulator [Pyxidicoccus parkwayensis]|uniref:Helix-turn-helix transcriptional regulator n=1 Tax=Pyxidicoccus parkwayensis TaxID=2813578 RepID=A0ABX7P1E5_9BACT|nr:helix-turn-helix transcriptional regulator [Pyxidicoccus parkwaysis]QSQ22283.1 helix-turn-helix transcriptional regulator [Pyxidicoccus parkwaysis]